jgi:hypothetical protein
MSHISPSQLKKALVEETPRELIDEILFVHKTYAQAKDYFTAKFGDGVGAVIEQYKEVVKNEFYPKRGEGKLRLAIAKKAISDFKKIATSQESVINIMLFYVEQGVRFTDEYGDINERFYISMETVFEEALKLMVKHKLIEGFRPRCDWIVGNACDGWGFREGLEGS